MYRHLYPQASFLNQTPSFPTALRQAGSDRGIHIPATLLSDVERMVFGGMSAVMAQTCVQPIETVKVRLQNEGTGAHPHPPHHYLVVVPGSVTACVFLPARGGRRRGSAGQVPRLRPRLPRDRRGGGRPRGAVQGAPLSSPYIGSYLIQEGVLGGLYKVRFCLAPT